MSDINRRTFVTSSASLLATSASLLLLRGTAAATENAAAPLSEKRTVMDGHHDMSEEMQRCIRLCQDCHARCLELINYCVMIGGAHASPTHIRLLMDCAQLCTVTADFMARESEYHNRTCTLCAELCRRCEESCSKIAGDHQLLKQCAELCRRCAESCDRMAVHGAV